MLVLGSWYCKVCHYRLGPQEVQFVICFRAEGHRLMPCYLGTHHCFVGVYSKEKVFALKDIHYHSLLCLPHHKRGLDYVCSCGKSISYYLPWYQFIGVCTTPLRSIQPFCANPKFGNTFGECVRHRIDTKMTSWRHMETEVFRQHCSMNNRLIAILLYVK